MILPIAGAAIGYTLGSAYAALGMIGPRPERTHMPPIIGAAAGAAIGFALQEL